MTRGNKLSPHSFNSFNLLQEPLTTLIETLIGALGVASSMQSHVQRLHDNELVPDSTSIVDKFLDHIWQPDDIIVIFKFLKFSWLCF